MPRVCARVLVTSLLMMAAAVVALPLIWMIAGSLIEQTPPERGQFTLRYYHTLFSDHPALLWLANSLLLTGGQTLFACTAATMAGYVLAHHRFVGRRLFHAMLIATLLLPAQVALPASWRLMLQFHLLDSYWALLLPAAANVLGTLLFHQAAAQIPHDTLDAARLDGCSELRIWWEVVLPAIRPTLTTFAVLTFTAHWNAYLWPQILLQNEQKYTLAIGMANLAALPQYRGQLGLMLAATTLSTVPAAILLLASRRTFDQSISDR